MPSETEKITLGQNRRRSRWSRFLEESSFLREYIWKYRGFFAVGLLALVLVDLMEIVPPILMKEAVDVAVEHRPMSTLVYLALGYIVTAIFQALGRYGWRMYLIRASMFAGRDLRSRFAHHLFNLSVSFFDRRRIGDLMSLTTSDNEAVRMALGAGLLVFADALFYFATVPVAMYLLSPELTLLAFLPLPIVPFIVMRNEKEIHSRYEKVQEQLGDLSAMVQESLSGVRVLKAFAKDGAQTSRFRRAGEEFVKLNLRLAWVQTSFGPILDFTMSLGMVLLLFVGGHYMIHDPSSAITLGTFVAFQRYIQKMIWPMAAIGMAVNHYQRAVSSSKRLKGIYAISTDIVEAEEPRLPDRFGQAEGLARVTRWQTKGRVEFKNLSFRFPGSDREVLSEISLEIHPGERVAFVGAIGAGKSALLSLLPRLYPVQSGMLFVDGVDVNDWPLEEIRRQVGYVSQDVFLFSETVSENIAFGLHDWVSDGGEYTQQATRLASVHEDILGLSGSYRTQLGERGVNLSGGQKQRLTIARALAKQPAILVLDDALSSVDVQTEEKILQGLRGRPFRNTEIIAAHRISTVRDADRIVVLDGGKIRQIGTHADLVADRRGAYRQFYEEQRLKEDLEQYSEALKVEVAP